MFRFAERWFGASLGFAEVQRPLGPNGGKCVAGTGSKPEPATMFAIGKGGNFVLVTVQRGAAGGDMPHEFNAFRTFGRAGGARP